MKRKGITTIKRTVSSQIYLRVPTPKLKGFCDKYGYGNWDTNNPTPRAELTVASDAEIIATYNAELRGLAHYDSLNNYLADDVKTKLNRLQYLSRYSLLKTLAGKHKIGIVPILHKLQRGNELVHRFEGKNSRYFDYSTWEQYPKTWKMKSQIRYS